MKKQILIISIFLSLFLSSCAGNYLLKINKPERDFYSGNPVVAAKQFNSEINKSGKDQLLFLLEAGLMLHTAEKYEKSNAVFLKAAAVAEKTGTSVSRQAKSLLTNERTTNYRGEDFERILIHMYTGINFIMLNQPESARIEFKKVNNFLKRIKTKSGKTYRQNVMAKYLTAIAYEMSGDLDNDESFWEFALIEYKQVKKIKPGLPMINRDISRMNKKLDNPKKRNLNKGELVVLYQAGQSAIKISRGNLMSNSDMRMSINISLRAMPLKAGVTIAAITIALNKAENPIPKFRKRSNKIKYLKIKIKNRIVGRTVLFEEIENTAVRTLIDDYSRLHKKVAAGLVTKIAVSIAAGFAAKKIAEQAKNIEGLGMAGQIISAGAGCIGAGTSAATGSALIASIKPDLRCWHTLPANLQLTRFFLKPGKYKITLEFFNYSNKKVRTEIDEIEIKKGKKTFANYRTLY